MVNLVVNFNQVQKRSDLNAVSLVLVTVMELVGPKRRSMVGVLLQLAYGVGFMRIVGEAYLIRDYYYLQIVSLTPVVIFVPYVLL